MSGKGDTRRPTDETAYADGWDRIFGVKDGVCSVHEGQVQDGKADGDSPLLAYGGEATPTGRGL